MTKFLDRRGHLPRTVNPDLTPCPKCGSSPEAHRHEFCENYQTVYVVTCEKRCLRKLLAPETSLTHAQARWEKAVAEAKQPSPDPFANPNAGIW